MDGESWFWRHEPRIRQAARFVGLLGLVGFAVCFYILLRGVFAEGRWWLMGLSSLSFCLMLVGFGTQVDDAKDEGRRLGFSEGAEAARAHGMAASSARPGGSEALPAPRRPARLGQR